MHGTIPPEKPDKPVEVKTRTITLTNRAPIKIVEDDWPILAHGEHGESHFYQGEEYGHSVQIFLRRHKNWNDKARWYDLHEILHAKYEWSRPCTDHEGFDIYYQKVRVGRLLAPEVICMDGRMKCQSINDIWRHIRETGDEIRERLHKPEHKKTVTLAVDTLFANLDAHEIK